jgi:1-acyl-sn-glycerol-3-phosphate acyltransferase
MFGSFPIAQSGWTLEQFLSSSIEKLSNGNTVMFFPEGKITVKQEQGYIRPGVGYLSEKSGRLVVPMRIDWTQKTLLKQLTISFGESISFQGKDSNLDLYQKHAKKIIDVIYSL